MAKHHTREDFRMSEKLKLIQAEIEREKAIRPSQGDILCMVVAEYMRDRGLQLPENKAKTADEWGFESSQTTS